jgi:flagellar biosynthesis/type III secretory pathway chaperone
MKADIRVGPTPGAAGIGSKLPDMGAGAYFSASGDRRRHESAAAADEPGISALANALTRLEEVISEETMALEARHSIDLQEFNRRKSRSLLELTRIIRGLPTNIMDDGLRQRLDRLRLGLNRNKELLRIHLAAAQEIAEVLAGAIGEAESDGTYDRSIKPGGRV